MSSDASFSLAAIQMATSPNVQGNLLEVARLVESAVDAGARLVVLPENFAYMGKRQEDMLQICEDEGQGPIQDFLVQLAARHGIWLVGGTVPLRAKVPNKVRGACLVLDPEGRRVARYDKMHLFDVNLVDVNERYHESETIEPGDQVVVVDTPCGKLGVAVCYDLRFPEMFRRMVDEGMEVLALPSAFTAVTGKAHWEILVRSRAVENLAYVAAAAQGGFHFNGRQTHGHSMIVDPWGTILAEVPRGTGFAKAEVDRAYMEATRRSFPVLEHRRLKCR